jgi:hypothetical protein
METSNLSSRPESSVQRTIFFALILSYYDDATLSAKQDFAVVSDPAIPTGKHSGFPPHSWEINGCL